jgi:hypothetical protein
VHTASMMCRQFLSRLQRLGGRAMF